MFDIKLSKQIKKVLETLLNKKIIGGKHTEEKNIFKRLKHLSKEENKIALKEWLWCVKEELILQKKSTGQIHVSLNPRKMKEILELIDENER